MSDSCKFCNATMTTDENADPTDICHDCAHARVEVLEERVTGLEAENERLKELLSVSEDYRRAYADGKYKLYAMGGEICEAAATNLPMSEGPLERAVRKALKP